MCKFPSTHLFLNCHSCWRELEKASISGWTRKWRAKGRQRRSSSLPKAAPEEERKSELDTEMHPSLDEMQEVGRACGLLADTWTDDVVVVVQSLNCVRLFVTPWTVACQASLSFTISQSLLKLMSFESVISSNRLILCCPLLLLPSICPATGLF